MRKLKFNFRPLVLVFVCLLFCVSVALLFFFHTGKIRFHQNELKLKENDNLALKEKVSLLDKELLAIKSEDQFVLNQKNLNEIKNIHDNFLKTVSVYEKLLDLKAFNSKLPKFDEQMALSLKYLADKNYASAAATLNKLEGQIAEEKAKATLTTKVPANLPVNNNPPESGYNRQRVKIDTGEFVVDIVSADLSSTKVIVDTASESDCSDNCPVLALSDYVSRSGAYAGVNGSYFCPATYPTCVGKTNSFDLLVMNKNKHYFNSDNNVYSVNPAVIFQGGSIRFVEKALEWGRDTGVDGVISNYPLLVFNKAIVYGGDNDAKHNNKGGRSFVGATGSKVYIGVVHSASVTESAKVLHALGIHNAMNLDDGGSTALWSSGYKVGPGRNIPNAVLFVRK
ncbi:MAG: phosphodiester glycosidase family protein [Patescibacteria group bacterium]|nr:phosphodiester glycosidase family protein [Patescibacteria group bacterium]